MSGAYPHILVTRVNPGINETELRTFEAKPMSVNVFRSNPPSLLSVGIVTRKATAVKLLAWLETDGFPGRDGHLFTGTRVPANATFARFDDKDAKAAQLNSITSGQRILHGIEECLNCLLSLQLRDSSFVGEAIDNV
jgi:hypothetical protein